MRINAVLWAIVLVLPTASATISNDNVNNDNSGTDCATHAFQYHQFLLLRHGGSVTAIYAVPNPRYGKAGITYQWFQFPDAPETFSDKPDPENENSAVAFGTGSTNDGMTCRNTFPMYYFGSIETDAFTIKWSSDDKNSGTLRVSVESGPIEVYPVQFDRMDDVYGQVDPKQWRSLSAKPAKIESKRP